MPNPSLNSLASSPIVIPCRSGIGNCPTNDAYAGLEQVPLDFVAANRIRPVADNDVHAVTGGGAQAVGHRVDVGVDTRADVLQIHDEHVDVPKHLGGRFARLAVERVHRHGSPRVPPVGRLDHVVLHVRSKAMLRTEEGGDGDVSVLDETIGRVPEGAVDRRRIADDADPAAGDEPAICLEQPIDPERDGR